MTQTLEPNIKDLVHFRKTTALFNSRYLKKKYLQYKFDDNINMVVLSSMNSRSCSQSAPQSNVESSCARLGHQSTPCPPILGLTVASTYNKGVVSFATSLIILEYFGKCQNSTWHSLKRNEFTVDALLLFPETHLGRQPGQEGFLCLWFQCGHLS